MVVVETIEALETWMDWEREHYLFAPDNIRSSRERNFESPEYREDLERRYAVSRAWKELEEALEVAEAVDKMENGEKVDFESYFDYTSGNQFYDEEDKTDEEQLKDEYGFELADVALFMLKTSTTIPGSNSHGKRYDIDLEEMSGWLEDSKHRVETGFQDATASIYRQLDPEGENAEIYDEVMKEDPEAGKLMRQTQDILGELSDIASGLPKESLTEYVVDKIIYNTEERNIVDMDADHPEPGKGYSRSEEI